MDAGAALTRLAFLGRCMSKLRAKADIKLPTSWKYVAISNANLING